MLQVISELDGIVQQSKAGEQIVVPRKIVQKLFGWPWWDHDLFLTQDQTAIDSKNLMKAFRNFESQRAMGTDETIERQLWLNTRLVNGTDYFILLNTLGKNTVLTISQIQECAKLGVNIALR